jgi:succinyl-diaminopimelate desuccinylase
MAEIIEQIIESISNSIKYDSSQKEGTKDYPFGKETADCLDHFLSLASSFGFETKNYDNYAGEVIFGSGKDLAILAHLDVVPAGSGWTHAPFGGEIDKANGRIWGRGAMDDKGPAIITLYALKALKDSGFQPKRTIKLIVGCNEENGWACIDYYNAHAQMPEEGFSPDADFPVIYAEKGILQIKLNFKAKGNFTALNGGERANMVCDYCEVNAPYNPRKAEKLGLTFKDGKIISRGKSAHGSTPELGVNAIPAILKYLDLNDIYNTLFVESFGLKSFEDVTGKLTFSPDVICQDGDDIYVTCDIRFPATYKKAQILEKIEALGVSYSEVHYQAPLYNDKQCKLITTLCEVYNEVTGKKTQPIAIGGGTYARALKCGAGFGPEEDGEESTIHKPDEYITFEKIEKCFKIYKLAIKRLTERE